MTSPLDLEAIAEHLRWCRRRNLAESTIYQRQRTLARTRTALRDVDPTLTLMTATTEDLELTLERRWEACSRATEVSHLRSFYRWCAWAGVRQPDPSTDLVRPQVPRGLPRPIRNDVLARAIELAPHPVRTILLLACLAGLRAKDMASLRVEHVRLDLDPPVIFVPEAKGGDVEAVALHPALADELASSMPAAGWLFPRLDDEPGPWKPWSISHRANHFLHDVVGTADTLHTLRHWYGTNVLRGCKDVRTTQRAMRHRSIVSTTIYTLVVPTQVASAVNTLPIPWVTPVDDVDEPWAA